MELESLHPLASSLVSLFSVGLDILCSSAQLQSLLEDGTQCHSSKRWNLAEVDCTMGCFS